ncbi:MAG: ComEC/Rec2 family competence protein [Bdellovibrionales bacterium]|jgi:hypothetical protein|nr:ComEC/Rec2 family competence protein [Bdellovibrionales bacterium]
MIHLAILLTIFTFVGHTILPITRAIITQPLHAHCLQFTPKARQKNEIQALVCGSSLKDFTTRESWRNLGLIHILVVSGGHLTILAQSLTATVRPVFNRLFFKLPRQNRLHRLPSWLIAIILTLFSLANQLQPPVFRAWLEWFCRAPLSKRGWRPLEVSLFSTWMALPFCASTFDLLSLALSFFASVAVESTTSGLRRFPKTSALALQCAVWWLLTPLLFTMGLPHPLTSLVNVVLAPFLGVTLIPLAMVTWLTGFGSVFDWFWRYLNAFVQVLAEALPAATPRLSQVQPLTLDGRVSQTSPTLAPYAWVLLAGVFCATLAILVRVRLRNEPPHGARPLLALAFGLLLASLIHHEITRALTAK